jgi:molybdenum cofactor biosynthesis protein B
MLSRALAGVAGRSAVFVLPGSPQAVELAMTELILPEVGHLLGQVRRAS